MPAVVVVVVDIEVVDAEGAVVVVVVPVVVGLTAMVVELAGTVVEAPFPSPLSVSAIDERAPHSSGPFPKLDPLIQYAEDQEIGRPSIDPEDLQFENTLVDPELGITGIVGPGLDDAMPGGAGTDPVADEGLDADLDR